MRGRRLSEFFEEFSNDEEDLRRSTATRIEMVVEANTVSCFQNALAMPITRSMIVALPAKDLLIAKRVVRFDLDG